MQSTQMVAPIKFDFRKLPAASKIKMDSSQLPSLYLAAKSALAECDAIDECKDISDKHTAIAAYAKQIKDDSLLRYAQRIKLRALERIGELLESIPDPQSQKAAIKDAGLAAVTAGRAQSLVRLPKRVRDQLIDQNNPPNMHQLSDRVRNYFGENQLGGYYAFSEKAERISNQPTDRAGYLYRLLSEFVADWDNILFGLRDGLPRGVRMDESDLAKLLPANLVNHAIEEAQTAIDTIESYKMALEARQVCEEN